MYPYSMLSQRAVYPRDVNGPLKTELQIVARGLHWELTEGFVPALHKFCRHQFFKLLDAEVLNQGLNHGYAGTFSPPVSL